MFQNRGSALHRVRGLLCGVPCHADHGRQSQSSGHGRWNLEGLKADPPPRNFTPGYDVMQKAGSQC